MIRRNVVITSFVLSGMPCARKVCYLSHICCPSLMFWQLFLIQNVLRLLKSNKKNHLHSANNSVLFHLKQREKHFSFLDHIIRVLGLYKNLMVPNSRTMVNPCKSLIYKRLKFSYLFFHFVSITVMAKTCYWIKTFQTQSLGRLL